MGVTNYPVLTWGTIIIALTVVIAGGVSLILGEIDMEEYLLLISVVGGPFAIGSGFARGMQSQGQASARDLMSKEPYE